ncbi:MAG: RNA polymerase sigma factor, partial [Armatimonadota bacterium]
YASIEIPDHSANPAGVFERRELEIKIQEAVQSLPPEYRVVVVLRDMHGLSYKEIAEAAGLSLENVKARIFRARAAIRRRLGSYIED